MPPRSIRPKNEPLSTDESVSDFKGGKRKAVSSACIPCRKRKSKCDGNLPSCSTCIAVYRTECCYDADSDHRRKGALKRDIQSLQQQNDSMDVIIASLRSLPEADAVSLLHSLRGDADPDALAESLRSNVRLPHNFAPQTLEADLAHEITTPAGGAGYENNPFHHPRLSRTESGDSEVSFRSSTTSAPARRQADWFTSPQDPELVDHLLRLYACWVHPFHGFVCWDLFTNDMARGRTEYCSSALLYAILAFACHYSDRPAARTDPASSITAGEHFATEAKRLIDETDRPSLTTVQALGILGVREGSVGRDSGAYQYVGRCVRMALEIGLHLNSLKQGMSEAECEARKITFWAVFNVETMCAVSLGRLSQLPRHATDVETPSMSIRSESQTWRPYVDANLSTGASAEQPSRVHLFKDQLSRLMELANDMVNTFYAPREVFTSRRLAAAYAQYQAWYRNLPSVFHLENTTLPHVIVLHMLYHACVLHLFRPYIKLDLRVANLYPHDTCTFCANEISALMGALRAMYGLRRVSSPIISLLLSASTIHLLNLPSEAAANNLCQGLSDLEAMSVNHGFAARAIDIIRALSSKWNIALPEDAAAIANYRMVSAAGPHLSPQTSFFAATIWRKQSSEGKKSSHSAHSHQKESPFSPPPAQPKPQRSASAPSTEPIFYDDPAAPLDPNHVHFWTPFPTQIMPHPHHDDVDMLDLGSQFAGQQQWHYGGGTQHLQHDQDFLTRHPSAGERAEGSTDAEYTTWRNDYE